MFRNRKDAGEQLAAKLAPYAAEDPIVLALPRGGVPIGYEIAKALDARLDVLVVRKLGAPFNPEFGIGAIAPGGVRVLDEAVITYLGLSTGDIERIERQERAELNRRVREYRSEGELPNIEGETVILVDDGLATGVTARAAVQAILQNNPRRLVVAIPVCALDSVHGLRAIMRDGVDEVVCLTASNDVAAIGFWYEDFSQVSDAEVINMLKLAAAPRANVVPRAGQHAA